MLAIMMKRLTIVALIALTFCLTGPAHAADTGGVQDAKGNDHVLQNPGKADGREGGETLTTAFPIPAIPYMDAGNTCDNIDDYDEVCPYTGSTSPDVVYAYSPPSTEIVDIDLCGSGYDTKVYVYENSPGNLYACNDDFYNGDPCGVYVSKIEGLTLSAGNTYYIVIDGYGGDCGDYILDVSAGSPPWTPLQFELTFSLDDVGINTIVGDDDSTYTILNLSDSFILNEFDQTGTLGKPVIPAMTLHVAMPPGVGADAVLALSFNKETIPISHPLYPAQPPRIPDGLEHNYDWHPPDPGVYEVDAAYPGKIVQLGGMTDIGGLGIAVIHVFPVEFNPIRQECSLYTSIRFEIHEGGEYIPGDYLPRDISLLGEVEYMERVDDMVINPGGHAFTPDPVPFDGPLPEDWKFDHMIITPQATYDTWWQLAAHRTKLGKSSIVYAVENIFNHYPGQDNVEKIRNFVHDAYHQCGIYYFLMAGTPSSIPMKSRDYIDGEDKYSDQYYSDFDDDWVDEVLVGRVTAEDPEEIRAYIDKLIRYETNPPDDYRRKALLIGMDLWEETHGENLMERIDANSLQPTGWDSEKVYDSHLSNHKEAVINALNSGKHLVAHCDHSHIDSFWVGKLKHQWYLNPQEIADLHPPPHNYMVIASVGCHTNRMDVSSIARHFVVHSKDKLAVAFGGSTHAGRLFEDYPGSLTGRLVKRFVHQMLRTRTIGCALAYAKDVPKLDLYEEVHKEVRWIFSLLGDPAMPVWHGPITFTPAVTYPSWEPPWNEGPFPMHVEDETGTAIEGAYVCLWEPSAADSSNIYVTGFTDSDGNLTLTVPASEAGMFVTVSHSDCLPYMAQLGMPISDVGFEHSPGRLTAHQAFPNPFISETTIHFDLPDAKPVHLRVFDVIGRCVRTLMEEDQKDAGRYGVVWDGTNSAGQRVAPGLYMYRLDAGTVTQTGKVMRVR